MKASANFPRVTVSMVDLAEERVCKEFGLPSAFGCCLWSNDALVLVDDFKPEVVGGLPFEVLAFWLASRDVRWFDAEEVVKGMMTGLNADRELETNLLGLGIGMGAEVVMLWRRWEETGGDLVWFCSLSLGFNSASEGEVLAPTANTGISLPLVFDSIAKW